MSGHPRLLDLFCGVGGATVGYQRAGFDVAGIDIAPQPDYQGDWFARTQWDDRDLWQGFDAIHASPPCQHDAAITKGTNAHLRDTYPNLYPAVKAALEMSGLPYVIENPAARADVVLCGEMFGLGVIRHRRFELGNWPTALFVEPAHPRHRGRVAGMRHGQWFQGPYFAVYGDGGGKGTVDQWQAAMGIDWTANRKSIAEAIPPAYTQFIGAQLIQALI
jgi:DNA (cytosine-5)-methyltransferase 1